MTTFSKANFSFSNYASLRPSYPPRLYDTVLKYHYGPRGYLIDLGTGHGLVARYLSKYFDKVIGTDPSAGMIEKAKSGTDADEFPNVDFREAPAEALQFIADASVDMVVAGQAAHWFDYPRHFAEMKRVLRPKGTLAFWGYKDHIFSDYPDATKMLQDFAYGDDALGPYWQQPGRSIVQSNLRRIEPPPSDWEVERIEYEPATKGLHSGQGTPFMEKRMTIAENMEYIRTWSSYHGWAEAHPDRKRRSAGGEGDCIDDLFDLIVEEEEDWREEGNAWKEKEVDVEWGTGLLLARKR